MSIFDNNGSTISSLLNLVKSPRVQILGKNARQTAMNNFGGPFGVKPPIQSVGSRQSGSSGFGNAGANIGSQLASLLGGGGNSPQQQPVDPQMALWNQLLQGLQSPVDMPSGINTEDLMNQVKDALDPIYDQRARSAEKRSAQGRGEMQSLYKQLGQDYERLAPEQMLQAEQTKQEIEDLYGQLRSNIKGDFARVSDDQAELFQQLGIQDALPSVLDDQTEINQESLTAASENQAQQLQRATDIGDMDATYYRKGSPISTMRSTEVTNDMLGQLENYLQQNDAERASAIQSGYMDQLGMANSNLQQQQQMAQQENARRQEMLMQMLMGGMQQKNQPMTADSFMAGLDPSAQNSVAGAYTRLQRSPEMVYGKVEDKRNPVPGTFVETTPEWQMAQVDEMLKRGEIDQQTHQLLLMYLQLSLQK